MSVYNSLSDSRFKLYDRRGHNVLALLAVKILLSDLQLLFQYLLPHMRTDFLTVPGPFVSSTAVEDMFPKANSVLNTRYRFSRQIRASSGRRLPRLSPLPSPACPCSSPYAGWRLLLRFFCSWISPPINTIHSLRA